MGWRVLDGVNRLQVVLATYGGERYLWNLWDEHGELLATSGTSYSREGDAARGAQRTYATLKELLEGKPVTADSVRALPADVLAGIVPDPNAPPGHR